MKKLMLAGVLACAVGTLSAAEPKEVALAAAKKLGEQSNYSWTAIVTVPEGAQFRPGPTEGKVEKAGAMHVSLSFGDNKTEAVKQGDKVAFTNRDGVWQSLAESENQEGRGRFMGGMVRNLRAPADQVAELVAGLKDCKAEGDAVYGELTEDAAKNMMRQRRAGGEAPAILGAKGSAKFWIKDGVLTKYEFKVVGKIEFNGNERDLDRTTTVEIKEVGTTKVEVPAGAKAKLG